MAVNLTADILVIGGGIAGISAAAELAADARVIALEMENQPGYHATGRSAAYFAPAYGNAVVRAITMSSEHFYRTPPADFCDVELINHRDALFIARSDQLGEMTAMQAENSFLVQVSEDYARQRVPILAEGYVAAALHDGSGGDLDVGAILQGYVRLLRRRGGALKTDQTVSAIQRKDGLWHLRTNAETFLAPVIVNAAGAWADGIAELAGVGGLGITPKRRTAILIDPPKGEDIAHWPLVLDIDEGFYFKPDAGQLLVSPADETPDTPGDARPEELDIAMAVSRYESVTDLAVERVKHSWAGFRSFAPDKSFVVGFDPRAEGFFWLAGQGGYGVQSAPGLSVFATALVNDVRMTGPYTRLLNYVDEVSPARFLL